MVTVNTYSYSPEAYIDKGFLESHDIPAEVISNPTASIFPGAALGAGEISLCVPDQYAQKAAQLLKDRPSE